MPFDTGYSTGAGDSAPSNLPRAVGMRAVMFGWVSTARRGSAARRVAARAAGQCSNNPRATGEEHQDAATVPRASSSLLERNGASRAQRSGAGGSPAGSSTYLSLGKAAGMWHKGNCYSPGPPDESGIDPPLCCLTRLLGEGGPITQQSRCRRVHFHPDLSQPHASCCPATPPRPSDFSLAAARTEPGTRQSIME